MKPVQKTRVDEAVYTRLIENIRDSVWKSGEKLPSENELCLQLGVSRVSVRSAFQRLRALGLVKTIQGKGTYVTQSDNADFSGFDRVLELTEKEFNEVNDLREVVESKAIQLIASRRDQVDLSAVKSAYEGMRESLRARDQVEYTKQDYLFHMAIINASGNDLFAQIATIFRTQYYKYFQEMNKFIFEDCTPSEELIQWCESEYDSHALLYAYLMDGKYDNTYELIRFFTRGNKKRFESYLRKQKNQVKEAKSH